MNTEENESKCKKCDGIGSYHIPEANHAVPCARCKGTGEAMLEQKVALEIYDHFRKAHESIAKIRNNFLLTGIENCAVETIDSALYMAESIIIGRMEG